MDCYRPFEDCIFVSFCYITSHLILAAGKRKPSVSQFGRPPWWLFWLELARLVFAVSWWLGWGRRPGVASWPVGPSSGCPGWSFSGRGQACVHVVSSSEGYSRESPGGGLRAPKCSRRLQAPLGPPLSLWVMSAGQGQVSVGRGSPRVWVQGSRNR